MTGPLAYREVRHAERETRRFLSSTKDLFTTRPDHTRWSRWRDTWRTANAYFTGLLVPGLKKMDRIAKTVDVPVGRIEAFVRESPWDHRALQACPHCGLPSEFTACSTPAQRAYVEAVGQRELKKMTEEAVLDILTYPNGREVTRTYDALDRLTSVSDVTDTIQSYTYDGTRLVSKSLGNGVSTSLSYDDALRLTVLEHATADENVRFDYAYARDNQRVSEAFRHAPSWSQEAAYDSAGRLDAATRSNHAVLDETATPIAAGLATAADWDLDGANNWLALDETRDGASSTQTRTHGPTNEIDAVTEGPDTVTFTHDADGNRVSDGEFNYTWDAFGRLRSVTNASAGALVASYAYDALDRRVTKMVAATGETTRYVYDGAVVVEEREGVGTVLRQFVHGQRIDEVLAMDRNLDGDGTATGAVDDRVYYVHDGLGTVVALTNATGYVVEGYLYDAYGAMAVVGPGANGSIEWGDDDTVSPTSGFENPYAFTGQRFDAESGLSYYRARYYDPVAGRFLSRDPIGVWGDPINMGNAYGYVGSNPVNQRDPSGAVCFNSWEMPCLDAYIKRLGHVWGAGDPFADRVGVAVKRVSSAVRESARTASATANSATNTAPTHVAAAASVDGAEPQGFPNPGDPSITISAGILYGGGLTFSRKGVSAHVSGSPSVGMTITASSGHRDQGRYHAVGGGIGGAVECSWKDSGDRQVRSDSASCGLGAGASIGVPYSYQYQSRTVEWFWRD